MRLRGAHRYLCMLREDEVPLQFRTEWWQIISALTRRGSLLGPDGVVYKNALDHTLDGMRNASGRKIAQQIYYLAWQIEYLSCKTSPTWPNNSFKPNPLRGSA